MFYSYTHEAPKIKWGKLNSHARDLEINDLYWRVVKVTDSLGLVLHSQIIKSQLLGKSEHASNRTIDKLLKANYLVRNDLIRHVNGNDKIYKFYTLSKKGLRAIESKRVTRYHRDWDHEEIIKRLLLIQYLLGTKQVQKFSEGTGEYPYKISRGDLPDLYVLSVKNNDVIVKEQIKWKRPENLLLVCSSIHHLTGLASEINPIENSTLAAAPVSKIFSDPKKYYWKNRKWIEEVVIRRDPNPKLL